MKIPWTFILLAYAGILTAMSPVTDKSSNTKRKAYHKAAIQERLSDMDCLFEPKYTTEVESYLRSFLTYGIKDAEVLLGRTVLYFPIFEHYLQLYGLPDELKYLPIIESNLRPYAISTAGAVGLWQFMGPTARAKGLKIDRYVDERRDPYKSTQAALQYLSELYDRFGSWELALAAYNCGAGRVRKAIRYAGTNDFWKLRHFLPRETRNYVPRFIAANYVANYYFLHGLSPKYPAFETQWTRTTKIYDYTTFGRISKLTGVQVSFLYRLNPGYRKGIIPGNPKGNFLILPEPAMALFKNQETDKTSLPVSEKVPNVKKSTYVVLAGDTIDKLARRFGCSVLDIMKWNGLKTSELYYRQELILYWPQRKSFHNRA